KATTPVNIDSQVQLADDVLTAPHPNMFKDQQLQLGGKAKSGRSLNEESGEEDGEKKKKGTFFSWSRSKSLGRSQKKKENGNCLKGDNRFSLKGEPCRASGPPTAKENPPQGCHVHLPDGSTSVMPIRGGFSIKEVLTGFCERQRISMAAVDLFLIGGDKVLDYYLSVGLKAKPTKPVTEVLRPVVAKYGLNLNNLVARLNGEQDPLDLGAPISSLDGQRVILEDKILKKGKGKQF
ncbi:hypothetical protein E2320_007897, partial [Naja naja]